jgi:hypothetical protein
MQSIAIANPIPGGQAHTSAQRAHSFVRRGLAFLLPTGRLYFYTECQAQRSEEEEFARNRGGVGFWNGSDDPRAKHKPGEVRS